MKRSRRVMLTMMGSAAIGAVSTGLVPRRDCGPGNTVVPGPDGVGTQVIMAWPAAGGR